MVDGLRRGLALPCRFLQTLKTDAIRFLQASGVDPELAQFTILFDLRSQHLEAHQRAPAADKQRDKPDGPGAEEDFHSDAIDPAAGRLKVSTRYTRQWPADRIRKRFWGCPNRAGPCDLCYTFGVECFRGGFLSMPMSAGCGLRLCAVVALVLLCLAPNSFAQVRTDVEVELDQFGVGGANFRPGDITPIRLRLTSRLEDEAMMVWVQWEVPNADGDIVEYGRPVALTRGRPTPVWLYAPLSPATTTTAVWPIRIFEYRDGVRRAEIGGKRISPLEVNAQAVPIGSGMIGVIGQRVMGLGAYGARFDQLDRSPATHEDTRIVFGIRPDQIPDRWEALLGFEAIAWSNASPQDLTSTTATTLREYVRRGGHLIISLPEDVNPWGFGQFGQTPLGDILPRREPRKVEGVMLSEVTPVMSKARGVLADFPISIRVFKELGGSFNSIDAPYESFIALPDGRVVAVQRIFGHGRVTIIGIDLSSQRLYSVPLSNGSVGLPQADAFWNRVLGRRSDTPTPTELDLIKKADLLARSLGGERDMGAGGLISQRIAMRSEAGVGLLVALLLFVSYWIVAGPGGFAVLRLYNRVHHAWLMFALAAGVFTAIAWGSVEVIRGKKPRVQHVTYLDHIARPDGTSLPEDPQYQRATSWFSLYTPGYARTRVGIESVPGQRDVLASWTPPGEMIYRFPNVDRYIVDVAENPASYAIPSRATATLLYANWHGGLDAEWGGMIRQDPNDPIRVVRDASGNELQLQGSLIHELPVPLSDVTVIWVRNARMPRVLYAVSEQAEAPFVPRVRSGQMPNLGFMWRQGSWAASVPFDLRAQNYTAQSLLARGIEDRYSAPFRMGSGGMMMQSLDAGTVGRYMEMLSFFHQITPPEYLKLRPADADSPGSVFHRRLGRELDLSTWFTRPCLIVIGYLRESALPVPLRVNGAKPESDGTTVVRWIFPLPLDEAAAFGSERAAEGGE